MPLALSQASALLLLFVALPFIVAAIIVALVSWRSPAVPPGLRTSEVLRDGESARAELVDWQDKSVSFLDRRPMVAFRLAIRLGDGPGDEPLELIVTQSITRAELASLTRGVAVDVRLSPDRTAGAIVMPIGSEAPRPR